MDIIIGAGLFAVGLYGILGHYRATKKRKWLIIGIIAIMCGTSLATWNLFYGYAVHHH
jgi:hypothetical protein